MDDIGERLEYFQELEKATRMLNHPGESLIFEPDFLYMVERVDVCISFLKTHVSSLAVLHCTYAKGSRIYRDIIAKLMSTSFDFSNA